MIIQSIEEVKDYTNNGENGRYCDTWDGYKITTDTKVLLLLIDNSDQCCEDWGYITSEGGLTEFIGATINSHRFINSADYNDCGILLKKFNGDYVDVLDCAFINIETDKGLLQFAVYTHHNGCYGHDIIFREEDI